MRLMDAKDPSFEKTLRKIAGRGIEDSSRVEKIVKDILEEVKKKGELEGFLQEAGVSPDKTSSFPKIIFEPFSVNL